MFAGGVFKVEQTVSTENVLPIRHRFFGKVNGEHPRSIVEGDDMLDDDRTVRLIVKLNRSVSRTYSLALRIT